MFEQVKAYSKPLTVANFGWVLTIVVPPFPTEVAVSYGNDRFTSSLYIDTSVNTALLAAAVIVAALVPHAGYYMLSPVSRGGRS